MKQFIIDLLTAGSRLSSKRFISLSGLVLLAACIVMSFIGINVPDVIIYALVSIILGSSVMTLMHNKPA